MTFQFFLHFFCSKFYPLDLNDEDSYSNVCCACACVYLSEDISERLECWLTVETKKSWKKIFFLFQHNIINLQNRRWMCYKNTMKKEKTEKKKDYKSFFLSQKLSKKLARKLIMKSAKNIWISFCLKKFLLFFRKLKEDWQTANTNILFFSLKRKKENNNTLNF